MKQVLPKPTVKRFERITPSMKGREYFALCRSLDHQQKNKIEIDKDAEEEEVSDLGELASPYLKPYLQKLDFTINNTYSNGRRR